MFCNYIFLISFVEGSQTDLMLRTVRKNSRLYTLMFVNIRENIPHC